MSNDQRKHAFSPVQPDDFASKVSALDAALAAEATASAQGETAVERAADMRAAAADAILSTPVFDVASLMEKLDAWFIQHHSGYRISDPQVQQRVAGGKDEAAKGLLAIYLDVAAIAQSEPHSLIGQEAVQRRAAAAFERKAWDEALACYEAAKAAYEAVAGGPDDLDDVAEWTAYTNRAWVLLSTPAPDAAAMAVKAAVGIDFAHAEEWGDSSGNPATLERILRSKAWDDGCIPVRLMQDALRLSGGGPLCDLVPAAEVLIAQEA